MSSCGNGLALSAARRPVLSYVCWGWMLLLGLPILIHGCLSAVQLIIFVADYWPAVDVSYSASLLGVGVLEVALGTFHLVACLSFIRHRAGGTALLMVASALDVVLLIGHATYNLYTHAELGSSAPPVLSLELPLSDLLRRLLVTALVSAVLALLQGLTTVHFLGRLLRERAAARAQIPPGLAPDPGDPASK